MGQFKIKNEELIGKRFGRLVVEEVFCKKGNSWYFKCKCDCGNEKIAQKHHLLKGDCKSCGCLPKEVSKKNGSKRRIYYKAFGKQYTIEEIVEKFDISKMSFYRRLKSGMSVEEALIRPKNFNIDKEIW